MEDEIILKPRKEYDYTPDPKIFYDIIIIGGGIVGFSTTMYAKRLGLNTLVIGDLFGGTIISTDVVENWPGFVSISGKKLAELVENHAKDYDIDILRAKVENVKEIKEGKKKHFKVSTKDTEFLGRTVVFATGTKIKELGVLGEKQYTGKGVSYCALCDGFLFKDKIVGVVGGSDSAIKESLLLTEYAKKVYVIYRGESVHPEPITLKKMEEKINQGKIEVINNTNVLEIKGDNFVKSVILDRDFNGKKELELDGLFVYVGHIPLSKLAKDLGVKTNKKDEIIINRDSETNINGVYAAGDVSDLDFKQAITGSAQGVSAAYHAYKYINESLEY
jgi:thioredoxin reductase (NADPH)